MFQIHSFCGKTAEMGKLHFFCNALPILNTRSKMYCDTDTRYTFQNVLRYRYSLLAGKNVSQICDTRYFNYSTCTCIRSWAYTYNTRVGQNTQKMYLNTNTKYLGFKVFKYKYKILFWKCIWNTNTKYSIQKKYFENTNTQNTFCKTKVQWNTK